ncbi:neutral zinc metallopeptidase [Planomonospora algeriensis]
MRIRMIAVLTGVAGLLLTGTAHAYPIKDEALTKNTLYTSGPLAAAECAEPAVKEGSIASAKKYWTAVHSCLNTVWGEHLKTAGLPFEKPVLKFGRIPKGFCGYDIGKSKSMAYYCDPSKTVLVQIGKDWTEDIDDLLLLNVAAEMYGQHVQNLVGIHAAYEEAPYANKKELNEQSRRYNLQSECLSGAFLRSVWSSLDRPASDWRDLQSILKNSGDAAGEPRTYGKGGSHVYWAKRGYAKGDPASCNTWSASSAKVS